MEIRKVKIEEYWPLIVRGTEEFGQIAVAENPEFNRLAESVYGCLKESFILPGEEEHATEYGVSRWEKMLGLAVTPDMTLDDRKAAILTYLSIKLPYTWRVLKRMLTELLGEGNVQVSFDNETQVLSVGIASTVGHLREQIDSLLARVLPKNLVVEYDPVPIDFTPIEYLRTNGNQYIETRTLKANETIEARCVFRGGNFSNWQIAASYSRTDLSHYNKISVGMVTNKCLGYQCHITAYPTRDGGVVNTGSLINSDNGYFVADKIVIGELNWGTSNKIVFHIDGEETVVREVPDARCSYERRLTLFKTRADYSSGNGSFLGSIYSFTALYGNKIKEALMPYLDGTGTPCMVDIESGAVYYNQGTGDFTYPTNEAPVMTLDLDEKFYAKLTEHGVRRLYKVPEGCTLSKDEYAAKHGFKELIEPPAPQTGYWTNVWKETDTQLICEWVETEPPMDVTEND